MKPLFDIRGLEAGYGAKKVIGVLDLSLREGDFTAFIGPNGSGKSTLIKCLTRHIIPSAGRVLFNGRDVSVVGRRALAKEVAVVQQYLPDVPSFRVREFINMGRFPHQGLLGLESGADRHAVDRAIELTGIAALEERRITELSGGERQLVYVARALAQSSRAIVLDEPVSHLDIAHAVRVMDVLMELYRMGVTVITVLHDINLASEYATRIIGIKGGLLFADGTPEEVVNYRTIESLFDTVCIVKENPISRRPFTYPVPGHLREKTGK